jgi:hypothetical protein
MPRTDMVLKVLIASPNDVSEEQDLLDGIIQELNNLWSARLGVRFESVKWETNCYPAVGSDAQSVVNSQIGDDYQIFIGILGNRFGTPTPRADSGTSEEFYRAYEKHKKDPENIDIMVYFNREPPASLDNLDANQYKLVESFREKLGKEGVLWWKYQNKEDFSFYVRGHLTKLMQKWADKERLDKPMVTVTVDNAKMKTKDNADIEIEELGYLDLIEVGEESFSDVNEIVKRMGEAITAIGNKMTERAKEVDKTKTPEGKPDIRKAKKVIDSAAKDMESFALRMEVEIPLFSKSYYVGIDAYSRAISIYSNELDSNKQETQRILENARYLRQSIEQANGCIIHFRAVVKKLPKFTKEFNKSKRHVVLVLDNLLKELTAAKNLAYNIESTVEKSDEGFSDGPHETTTDSTPLSG